MHRTSVENIEIIALIDGVRPSRAASVYPHVGEQLARFNDRLTPDGGIDLTYACFLVRADGQTLLVDTGNGPERDGQLPQELLAAGVRPEEVNLVVFTHIHGDHTGWAIDRGTGRPTFANARYLVARTDWDQSRSAETPAASFTRDIAPLETLGVLDLVEGERQLTASVTAAPAPGHTPGHLMVLVASGDQKVALIGDAAITTIDIEEPAWSTSWEADRAAATATRIALLDRFEREQAVIGASHLPGGLGRLVRNGERRVWQPL